MNVQEGLPVGIARPHLDQLVGLARRAGAACAAVVYPCSVTSLESVALARRMGLIEPVVLGPRAHIESIAHQADIDLHGCRFVDTGPDSEAAARKAVELCRSDEAALMMKGSLHTDELLSIAIGREGGLRSSRRASHVFVLDVPGWDRPILMADCVVNITPSLMEKRDITQNAIEVAHSMGLSRPYVAVLSAVETINPAIPGTIDAAALSKMAERGQITGADVEGPLSYDVAMFPEAARTKGIAIDGAREPDILIMPNMEAGNMLYKQLVYGANAGCAGLVVGMRVPIVCNSRAEPPENRVASCALAVIQRAPH
jgi:phosphate acetyltransferase